MARRWMNVYLSLTSLLRFGVGLHFATYVLFLRSRGLNLWEVNLVNAWFAGALIVFEFPTGLIADVWGRKSSTITACLISCVGFLVYAFSESFWDFVAAEVILAMGSACATGAADAWIVDLMKHHDPNVDLTPLFTRGNYLQRLSGLAGAVAGGYLSEISLMIPWIGAGVTELLVAGLYFFLLPESYFIPAGGNIRTHLQKGVLVATGALRKGVQRPALRTLMVTGLLTAFCMQPINMYWQPFYQGALPGGSAFGWFFAGASIFSIAGVWLSGKIAQKHPGNIFSYFFANQILVGIFLVAAACAGPWAAVSIALFLTHEIGRGANGFYTDLLLNRHTDSEDRASQLSLDALTGDVGMIAGLVASGFVAEHWSIGSSWMLFSAFFIATNIVLWKKNHGAISAPVGSG